MMEILRHLLVEADEHLSSEIQQLDTSRLARAVDRSTSSRAMIGNLLPLSKFSALGRLVVDLRSPYQNFYPSDLKLNEDQILHYSSSDVRQSVKLPEHANFGTRLKNALNPGSKSERASWLDLITVESKTYHLLNVISYFERLVGQNETKQWLEANLKHGSNVYLVVGMQTAVDPRISQGSRNFVDASIPLTSVVGVINEGGVSLDPQISSLRETSTRFTAVGERVLALRYCRLKFSRFGKKKMENLSLEKLTPWQIYLGGSELER
jgi:hypothetical protein